MTEKGSGPVVRTVLQQCLRARLQVKPAEEDQEAQFVQVRQTHTAHLSTRLFVCLFPVGQFHLNLFSGSGDILLTKIQIHKMNIKKLVVIQQMNTFCKQQQNTKN